jgi:transposase
VQAHSEAEQFEYLEPGRGTCRSQKGRTGYVWWQRGHSPRGLRDVGHQSVGVIGAVCPARDTGVALVMTRLDIAAMNLFLAELSQAVAPGAHGIVLLDRAGWHTFSDLVVPENLCLIFLLPYSPELNPIERLWLYLRDNHFSHCVFQTTDEIVDTCCDAWNWLLAQTGRIRSMCSYPSLKRVND